MSRALSNCLPDVIDFPPCTLVPLELLLFLLAGVDCRDRAALLRDHLPDEAGIEGGEEKSAVGPSRNAARAGIRDRDGIFADQDAVRLHAADLVGGICREPEIAIRRDANAAQRRLRRRDRVPRDPALTIDAAERIGAGFDEPDAVVRMRSHRPRLAVVTGNGKLRHLSG